MLRTAPDERHDFTGWSVERFGTRYFVLLIIGGGMRIKHARHEITANEFADARGGRLGRRHFVDKYGVQELLPADPGPVFKVVILTGGAVILAAGGWLVGHKLGWW